MNLRVLKIIDGTTVDGPGFRTSIYFAGCRHECPGCHNPSSWDFEAGADMSVSQILERISENDMDVSLSGGDPLYQAEALTCLCRMIKDSGKSIWLYTGFLYEDILANPVYAPLLKYVDVVVDGPFINQLRDTALLFRGSSNQRLIDVAKSQCGKIVEWESEF